jgi:hypothetical protein
MSYPWTSDARKELPLVCQCSPDGKVVLAIYPAVDPCCPLEALICGKRPHTGQEFKIKMLFGYGAKETDIKVRWALGDSTLGIFLRDQCWLMYRYGAYRRRNREYYRMPPRKPFTPAEIEYIGAKKHVQIPQTK